MARQPKTRQAKSKYERNKIYPCGRCGRKNSTYHLDTVKGQITTVCFPKQPCPPPTV